MKYDIINEMQKSGFRIVTENRSVTFPDAPLKTREISGRHVGMADDADSKSVVREDVRVQVPLPALKEPLYGRDHPISSCGGFFSEQKQDVRC